MNKEWLAYEDLKPVEPEWLIERVIPKRSTICLYGQRGKGKTFLALDLALCVASGIDWNGRAVQQHGVAYLLAENPHGLRRRIDGWTVHHKLGTDMALPLFGRASNCFFIGTGGRPLNRPAEIERLIPLLKEVPNLGLVVLDPLISFMDGQENDARNMQEFVDGLREVVNKRNCSVLVIHHEGKNNYHNSRGARGSSALEAAMDAVLYLKRKNKAITSLEFTKQREMEEPSPLMLRFDRAPGENDRELGIFPVIAESAVEPRFDGKKAEQAEQDRMVIEAVISLTQEEPSTEISHIEKHLSKHHPIDWQYPTRILRDVVKRLTGTAFTVKGKSPQQISLLSKHPLEIEPVN